MKETGQEQPDSRLLVGDVRETLKTVADNTVDCCVTSPPYWGLRDYGETGQIGLEQSPEQYVAELVAVFREVRRVLKDNGTLWLNLGDSYASFRDGKVTPDTARGDSDGTLVEKGKASNRMASSFVNTSIKHKDIVGIPWRLAFALQADGWYLRQDIIWHKPNPMPESVTDRCTKAHEYIFLLSKSNRYYFDSDAIKEPATTENGRARQFGASNQEGTMRNDEGRIFNDNGFRNKRDVWTIPVKPYQGAHFATFPPDLITPCILAGSPVGGTVLDPFFGAGTTGLVAQQYNRKWIGCELNSTYAQIAIDRIADGRTLFTI